LYSFQQEFYLLLKIIILLWKFINRKLKRCAH